jgi:hypothetical protein
VTWAEATVIKILFTIARIVGKDLEPSIKQEIDQIRMQISNASRS